MSFSGLLVSAGVAACLATLWLYIRLNDSKLLSQPAEVRALTPSRATVAGVRALAARVENATHPVLAQLPPATGRRYVVVGGAGFLGGWIVLHLLARGEDPRHIRVLDIRKPTRKDLTTGDVTKVDFRQVDITDTKAVHAAFDAPWPASTKDNRGGAPPSLTVLHTASVIRLWERKKFLIPASAKVNVDGAQNVLDASIAAGADILVYTSSGSVAVRPTRLLLWPWERLPRFFVQAIDDDDTRTPQRHEDFWSNYSYTKCDAERIIRRADRSPSGEGCIRTGAIRPGNAIYGRGGDPLAEAYMKRKVCPTWIQNTIHAFCGVENVSLAHLCYEARLIELQTAKSTSNPDIGGQSFIVTDPGPPQSYGDVYLTLTTLTNGETRFPLLSPTVMLLVSHVVEALYNARRHLQASSLAILRLLVRVVPAIEGDIVNLQPPLFSLTSVHLVFDDSRARLPPSRGGLGFTGGFTTMEGMCRLVQDFMKGEHAESDQTTSGQVTFDAGVSKGLHGLLGDNENLINAAQLDARQTVS